MITWLPSSTAIFYTALRAMSVGGGVMMGLTDEGDLVLVVVDRDTA
jgi:hypothetical protein